MMGIAWYRKEQWARLRELDAAPDALHDTYEQWLASIRKTLSVLRSEGVLVRKVLLDVDEVAEWCAQRGRPFNGASRSVFVLEALQASMSSQARRRSKDEAGSSKQQKGESVRGTEAKTLEGFGPNAADAVPAILRAMPDGSTRVRAAASRTLRRLRGR